MFNFMFMLDVYQLCINNLYYRMYNVPLILQKNIYNAEYLSISF